MACDCIAFDSFRYRINSSAVSNESSKLSETDC